MNKLISIIAIIIISLLSSLSYGLSNNKYGIVLDSETNGPVPNVIIYVEELNRTITSDDDGKFSLSGFENGTYKFVLKHIAYEENISDVSVYSDMSNVLVFYLIPKNIELDAVIISDYESFSKFDDLQELLNVLKGRNLQKQLGLTLASTLKNEAGLAMRSMGPAPSRPVIRGLGSNRVHISEDGIKTVDLSATSPDHAVTIDPFTISRIEVIRGPKVLTVSPTSIGGVVNAVRGEIPEVIHDNLTGQIGAFGESVNKGYVGSIRIEAPLKPLVIKAEVSKRKTNDLSTPDKTLDNSYSENMNMSLASSFIFNNGFWGASFRNYELDYGVPGGFVGAHPNGVDIKIKKQQYSVKSKYHFDEGSFENLDFSFSRVYYRHKEFENSGKIGSEFEVVNYGADIKLHHHKLFYFMNGIIGTSLEYRNFDVGGFVFTSPSKSINISTFIFENLEYNKFSFEMGARYDFNKINPKVEKLNSNIGEISERTFNTYSLSLSTLYQQSKHVYFGINLSKSSRVPSIEELFSQGPHLAAYSYEIGNPNLKAESGLGAEIFTYHKFDNIYFNFNIFGNSLDNYIIPRNTGEINFATFLPIYKTEGVAAILYGVESRFDWDITNNIQFSNTISYTRGKFRDEGNLPQIPPIKGLSEVKYFTNEYSVGLSGEWTTSQTKLDLFEQRTPGYFIINLFAQYSYVSDHITSNISLNIDNLFNRVYRNHLSRIKSILPEAGRNIRCTYKMFFHL